MRIALVVFALTFVGCAHAPIFKEEAPKTAQIPIPCGANDCGKPAQWEAQ